MGLRIPVAIAGAIFCFQTAGAQDLRWTHFGLRPLGMGNAFVATADDYNALFYNPAGLARLKTWDGEFFNPHAEISTKTYSVINETLDFAQSGSTDLPDVLDFLEKQVGDTHHVAFGLTPHLIFPHFGFALAPEMHADLVIHRDIAIGVDVGPTFIAPIAFALNFFEKRLSVGAGVKFVARGGVDRDFDIQSIEALKSSDSTTGEGPKLSDFVIGGFGAGLDVGLLFTPTETMEPTFGLSITDLGSTTYTEMDIGGTATGRPPMRLMSVNTGVSLKPWTMGDMYLRTEVDVHAANQPASFSRKLNLGLEWGYKDLLKLQSGLYQGYLTAGMQFDVGLLNLKLVTYAEELSPIAGASDTLVDRRVALQFKLLL